MAFSQPALPSRGRKSWYRLEAGMKSSIEKNEMDWNI